MAVANDIQAHPTNQQPLLQVEELAVHLDSDRGTLRVVDGVGFEIRRGETFALVGESGCGKSMTALALLRLLPERIGHLAGGRLLLAGQDLAQASEAEMRRVRGGRVAMIFQEPMTSLNPVMPVGEQIAESLRLHRGLRSDALRDEVIGLLEAVGIPDPARRCGEFPHQLSGGMKQRIMIAMALAGQPELLIADEPTTALDVTIQAQVLELLQRLRRERGMAILLITHDLGVVAEQADDVGVMYAGHIVERASRDAFFEERLHPYSQKLFESLPTMGKRDQPLAVIPGSVPSPEHPFAGCRFAERCAHAWELCQREAPRWLEPRPGHGVRCHLHDPEVAKPGEVAAAEAAVAVAAESAGGGEELLAVRDLKVHFPIQRGFLKRTVGHVYAVDGVSLEVPRGRTLALVGESGCGKTTAGKAILQLTRPTAGSVRFGGSELTELSSKELRGRRRDFQIVFQDPFASMNPRMTVGEIVEEGMLAQGIGGNKAARRARVVALLEHVGLSAAATERYPHEFSGGQRQRVCIARALAVEPKLIVCDEPTSALDVSVQAQILNLLRGLQGELGLSYLFITHNLAVVGYLAHEVAVMYLGRIVEQGPVAAVLAQPRHPYTQALMAAVPSIEAEGRHEVLRVEGELPSPSKPPAGCHFHPRCPQAMAACREGYPEARTLGDGHQVRCFLYS